MKASDRVERDQKILRLWIAGGSYPRIAQAVGLSARQVERIVKSTLAAGAARRALLSEEALAVWQERHERLFESHWHLALNGDHRSAELCRRLLDQNAKLHGLYGEGGGSATPGLPAPTAPLSSGDVADSGQESEEPADELAKLRANRAAGA